MKITNNAENLIDARDVEVTFSEIDSCPRCHRYIEPVFLNGFVHKSDGKTLFTIVNYCRGCHMIHLATYTATQTGVRPRSIQYNCSFLKSEPLYPTTTCFDESIQLLSPRFVDIYNQSETAESIGLLEIAGTGFRKALEFLIKDYLISKNPNNKSQIITSTLSHAISQLGHEPLQTVASRAAWFGNDETHYYRKHDTDITALKNMINLTVHWILLLIGTEQAAAINPK